MGSRSVTLAHEQLRTGHAVRLSSNRAFGFTIAALLIILGVRPLRLSLVIAALCIAGIAIIAPRILAPLHWLWFRIAILLHHVFNPILMAILFFGLLTPLGWIMRLFGRRPLSLERDGRSYWLPRTEAPASMKVPF